MQKELLNQAMALFDSPEKWNAFVELANQKETIKWHYFQKLKQPLLNYFNANPVEGWACEPWGNHLYDVRWYLPEYGKNSLGLAIGWTFEFHLRLEDPAGFDSEKMTQLLKTDYSMLLSGFNRIDRQFEHHSKAIETRNYAFGSPYDFNFDNAQLDKLSWYAGNKTDDFVRQIIEKVERFRQNKEFTRMLRELHERTKIPATPQTL